MNISFKGRLIIYFTKIDDYVRASRELKALATNSKKYNRMKETTRTMGISFASISHEKVLKAGEGVISASNSLN